ncbi:hypothetical protein D4764_13G0001770 [Takifugu flavidus]|uniref:Uncharacterized protein n=1 Tax=Takifugu flavidus TaxID=433684 RepID=A0A5C6P7W9_9TELE|nr:hypothetical protein D4764_13G0001770 [Takifugu flavidus]
MAGKPVSPKVLRINFSVEKEWLGDNTVQQILRNYRTIVIHLNLRGCTSLNWPSFQSISECPTFQPNLRPPF